MKKLTVGFLVLTMVLTLCGCGEIGEQLKDNIIKDGQFAIDNDPSIDKDLTQDLVDALKGEKDKRVQFVKGGTNSAHPDVTYGEAFENFFSDPSWRHFKGTQEGPDDNEDGEPDYTVDDVDVVEFTGGCVYADTEVTALIQFVLDIDGGTFEPVFLSLNDVPQNKLMLMGLLDTVFTQAEEDLGVGTATRPPETQAPPQVPAGDPSSDPGDVSGEYYSDSRNGYYIELDSSNPTYDGIFGFIIDGVKYEGGGLYRLTQNDYAGTTYDGVDYEFHFEKPNDSVFMDVKEFGNYIETVQKDAKFLEGDYAGYDLYGWQGQFSESSGSITVDLLVLPSDVEYNCNLYWNYGRMMETGTVAPGSPAVLSEGTVITIDLNPDGTIFVALDQGGSHYEFFMYQ